jgi:glycosyltransferase involved in cell wall biosynthesis
MLTESQITAVSTYGRAGASTRVRLYDWFESLGITSERFEYLSTSDNQPSTILKSPYQALRAEANLRRLLSQLSARTLVLSRQASPFSSGRLEAALLRAAKWSIYDFDDALYSDTETWTRKIWSKQKLWMRSVEAADVVIAGSDILASRADDISRNVVMVPSCIDPAAYQPKTDFTIGETPTAVWIGSPATEPFLQLISEPLLALHRERGLRLSVISGGNSSLGQLDAMVDRVPWSEATFAEDIASADFGVMPLPDNEFTRGKCSYKLLQYAASGIPLIGSPVGANSGALTTLGGFAPESPSEWRESAGEIMDMTPARRAAAGQNARSQVTSDFSFEAWKSTWLKATGLSAGPPSNQLKPRS